jgi:putative hydrolase of the HAD superfamily
MPARRRPKPSLQASLGASATGFGRFEHTEAGLVRVVFWDFDGTLAWRSGLWRSSLITALDEVAPGHGVTADQVRPGLQGGFPWHRHHQPHPHLDTSARWWNDLTPVLTAAYERAGVPAAVAAAAVTRIPRVYTDPQHWTVFPDTRPALTRLRAAGWRNVILSNHVPELPGLVTALGMADLVDDVITSAGTGYEKPHPQMYAAALAAAGHPDQAWMVGDNPVADVAGAVAAGLPAILVRAGTDLHSAAATILAG